jgi:hypothetical protein
MPGAKNTNSVQLFYSYAHADSDVREKLDRHLARLRSEKLIDAWVDRRMTAGADFNADIEAALRASQIILLMISSDFIASDYCRKEMTVALEVHRQAGVRVVPVILRPCDWRFGELETLLALPTDAKPVTHWPTLDDGLFNVALGVRALVQEIRLGTPASGRESGSGQPWTGRTRPVSGDLVVKLCNRGAHDALLMRHCRNWLRTQPRAPLFLIVPGEDVQRHESLVDRWQLDRLPELAGSLGLEQTGFPPQLKVKWPGEGSLDARKWALAEDVFRCAKAQSLFNDTQLSAAPLKAVPSLRERPFVILRHMIFEEQWPQAAPLLKWYLEFWAKAADLDPLPRFVNIVNIVYTATTNPLFSLLSRTLRLADRSPGARIRSQIREMFAPAEDGAAARAACPAVVMPELPNIYRSHVQEWFDSLDPQAYRFTLEYRDQQLDTLFRSKGRKLDFVKMKQVEDHLGRLLESIAV